MIFGNLNSTSGCIIATLEVSEPETEEEEEVIEE